jgi:hypothetical protein
MNMGDLTEQQKDGALKSLMFLKEKRCGRVKGRFCADGRKQREIYTKEEAASPTVMHESVMLTSIIDAKENRDVAVTYVPGAYLNADMDDEVIILIEGIQAELLVTTAPQIYRKYLGVGKNNRPVLYVKLRKALYGCLKSALLFYKKLTSDLVAHGFKINPYDPCVANKMVKGKQMTICWHVDDLKISHVDKREVTRMLRWLEKMYGEMRTTRGKQHEYLGMKLDFRKRGKVRVSMIEYLEEIIDEFPEAVEATVSSPAADHLFKINEECTPLDEEMARSFHTMTAKLLFLCKRARQDIQTAVAFLTTRVKGPDEDDWKKLRRVMVSLTGTRKLVRTLSATKLNITTWWVDGAYAVHPDMRGHTGMTMSLGEGSVFSVSTKQKLNTKSSTETELVGVDDVLPYVLWTSYFLEAQGYKIETAQVFQDNMSAMLLEKNGKWSSGKKTKHINVRYFFVKDRIDRGEVEISHCGTKDMIGDFFTKPLQGAQFRKFRKAILNLED